MVRRFNPGDVLYIKYLRLEKKRKKFYFRRKEFFGKCIGFKNQLIKRSVILRKAVKLNEVEQVFVLDSPFIWGIRVQKGFKPRYKKMLFLREYSGKFSRVRVLTRFKKRLSAKGLSLKGLSALEDD